MTPEQDPANAAQKSGYRSSEYWLTVAAFLVGALLAAGVFPVDSPTMKVLGLAASVLAALGYQAQRGFVKASGNKAAALVAASRVVSLTVEPPNPS